MKIILLIMVGISLLNAAFIKNRDVVSDSVSGLEWQDDNGVILSMSWQDAIAHCEALEVGKYSDWRLPNINELKSIIDRSKFDPAIVNGFENTINDYYWSSTTLNFGNTHAWVVYFGNGMVGFSRKDGNNYVRCVRDGQ